MKLMFVFACAALLSTAICLPAIAEKKEKRRIWEMPATGNRDVITLDNGNKFEGVILSEEDDGIQFIVIRKSRKPYQAGIQRDRIRAIEKLTPEKRAPIKSQLQAQLSKQQAAANKGLVAYKQWQTAEHVRQVEEQKAAIKEAQRQAAIAAERARKTAFEAAEQERRNAETASRIDANRVWADFFRPRADWYRTRRYYWRY